MACLMRLFENDCLSSVAHCEARLSLGFSHRDKTTRLTRREHFGPLRVQKPLYPEGDEVCHAIVVHPPGGVVGGDALAIDVRLEDRASALIATPGAAKWYKANGKTSQQSVRLDAGAEASLEWLPQETIFFDAAHVDLEHDVVLGKDASYIGSEILCFGRTASGEKFSSGSVRQRTRIRRDGRLLWFEQGRMDAGASAMHSPLGLAGRSVCATLIAVGKTLPSAAIATMREEIQEEARAHADSADMFGITQMKSVVAVRYLGNSSETARRITMCAWQLLRPQLIGRTAVVPRIWNT
jgi:urease accessory protein